MTKCSDSLPQQQGQFAEQAGCHLLLFDRGSANGVKQIHCGDEVLLVRSKVPFHQWQYNLKNYATQYT